MTEAIRRPELELALSRGLDVDGLAEDPEVAALAGPLSRLDRDGDGRLSSERELDAVFSLLDRRDGRRDGRIRSMGANLTARALARRASAAVVPGQAPSAERAIAFVGLTAASRAEAASLARSAPVHLATDRADGTDVAEGGDGELYGLDAARGRRGFSRSLGLPDRAAAAVEGVLAETAPRARREIALLARTWAPAYRGEATPARLVISGHGDGSTFFETADDALDGASIVALARALPRAAKAVRHLHLAACQFGYEARMAPLRDAFPALSSIWGYAGFSPTGAAARAHQRAWERATRDEDSVPSVALVAGTRRGDAVAVWTREGGWTGPAQRELGVLMRALSAGRAVYEGFLRGEREPRDPGQGFLAERYQVLQEATAHLDFADQSPSFRASVTAERDTVLRLRFFRTHVTRAFGRVHRTAIRRGYDAIGETPPVFAGMTRGEALAEVRRFREAAVSTRGAAARLSRLMERALVQLEPAAVPAHWL